MTQKLRYTLVVRHPETGEATAVVAGEPIPGWASGLVHKDDLEPAVDEGKPAKRAAAKRPDNK